MKFSKIVCPVEVTSDNGTYPLENETKLFRLTVAVQVVALFCKRAVNLLRSDIKSLLTLHDSERYYTDGCKKCKLIFEEARVPKETRKVGLIDSFLELLKCSQ